MLRDVVPFSEPLGRSAARSDRAIGAFITFIERKLNARFFVDADDTQHNDPKILGIARALRRAGIILHHSAPAHFFDEPRILQWGISYSSGFERHIAGGMSVESSEAAFIPALAEALERSIWMNEDDYFVSPLRATTEAAKRRGNILAPERFAGFSTAQREGNPRLTLVPNAEYLWIEGRSLIHEVPIWLPAQVASGLHGSRVNNQKVKEPMILVPITTGLATGETRGKALLGGILEIVERDAFMITWLNRLTPPRLDLAGAARARPSLAGLLEKCAKYRLDVEVLLLPTDVPTYAVCAVVRDSHGGPETTVGLKAHYQAGKAAEGALLEALRSRQNIRTRNKRHTHGKEKDKAKIYHMERIEYWAKEGRYELLRFLTNGAETTPQSAWDGDTDESHLERLTKWCREEKYECAVVDLGRSAKNVTPWHVVMAVMPEMQPVHQSEQFPYLGGARLREVPKKMGFASRTELFTEEPHPFA